MKFQLAKIKQASFIAQLVNSAYRGEPSRAGWTTEADILEGLRTTADEIKQLICAENSLILLAIDKDALVGTICVERKLLIANIGMFVVSPSLQNGGIGKALLAAAEKLAQQKWVLTTLQMQVISIRHELIAFYERRGYLRTDALVDFPINPSVWQPKVAHLKLAILQKPAHT
ncbi:MAG: GNAT family N-acetyltransferase [Methylophilaceae bacterium]